MRIAQVAPLYESVPPKFYGGTERIVAYLSDELVRQGHEVTLFASGESRTAARLVSVTPHALRSADAAAAVSAHTLMIEEVAQRAGAFDVIHFHTDAIHLPVARRLSTPSVTTLHGRLDLPGLVPLYHEFRDIPLVSVSDAQRAPLALGPSWLGTVHHGLPRLLYEQGNGGGGYLAFLGRIASEKRLDRAVEIAHATALPLRIAAKVDPTDRRYYEEEILPLLDDPLIEFVGEIGDAEKQAFLGNARALLFPIDWPEPFGIVMIEAMACGTPVIAFEGGSVREVLDDGVTGLVVTDIARAVEAVRHLPELDRTACRATFETRFAADRMAADYVRLYRRV